MFARWLLPKSGKKVVETIKSVRPGTKTGAKSVNYWQHKASIARFKAATTDLKATTRKINVAIEIISFITNEYLKNISLVKKDVR